MKINNEIKVGLMVFISLLILAGLTIKVGTFNLKKEGYTVKTVFKNISGITTNSPVMFNGFEVGLVQSVDIVDDGKSTNMELTLWLKKDVKLREGVVATIKNLGFMGEKYLDLSSGKTSGDYLKAGAVLIGKEPPSFEALVEKGQNIAENIKSITGNIDERLTKNKQEIDELVRGLNSTVKHIDSISANADERLKLNSKTIDDIVENLHKVSVNFDEMSYDLKENPWKLLYRPK